MRTSGIAYFRVTQLAMASHASHARRGADTAITSLLLGVALLVQCCHGQPQQTADQNSAAVSFLAPRQATPLPLQGLSAGAPQGRVKDATSPIERGDATWGSYLTSTSSDGLGTGPTKVGAHGFECCYSGMRRCCYFCVIVHPCM